MAGLLKRLHEVLVSGPERLLPGPIRRRLSAEGFGIRRFLEEVAREVRPTDRVLDAGAGRRPYRDLFAHARYASTDWGHPPDGRHDFLCDLHAVPQPDGTYDVVVCTQVLQHVEYPLTVLREFHRILKPGGRLYLTACQSWGIITHPHHYYNFTKYGLASLLRDAGFEAAVIRPRGGVFWYLGHLLRRLPLYLLVQYRSRPVVLVCLLPFFLLGTVVFGFFVPLGFHYLDRLDRVQDFTLGYACRARKPGGTGGPPRREGGP